MLLLLVGYGLWSGRGEEEVITDLAYVVDGDSLRLQGRDIRIHGIDAPELQQFCRRDGLDYRCGAESRAVLAALVADQPVTCTIMDTDKYGRGLARCTIDGRDIGREMVSRGQAIAYGDHVAAEEGARAARRGLWAGEFEPPEAWRAETGATEVQ